MSTTGKGFIVTSQGAVITSGNAATGSVQALPSVNCNQLALFGSVLATRLDNQVDLSTAGYAKNGAYYQNLAASTPVTIDFTAIASAATASAGDNSLTTLNDIQFTNLGAQDVKIGAAGSTPLLLGLGGTTPTFTVPANGGVVHLKFPAGLTISGANNLKADPGGAGAQLGVAFGGA